MKLKDFFKYKSKNAKQAALDFAKEVLPNKTIDNFEELENLEMSEFAEDDAKEILAILKKSYPRYTPFYIYDLQLKEEASIFEKNVEEFVSPENFEFTINDRYSLSKFEIGKDDEAFSIKMLINESNVTYDYNGRSVETQKINEEDLIIYFYYKDNILLINTGKETLANLIFYSFLMHNFHEYISMNPIKVSATKLRNIRTSNIVDDKVTIFMLELLTKKLLGSKISVNDYRTLGISKPKSERIKSIVLRGNELNKVPEIAERLTQGYQLKKADVQIRYILNSSGDTYDATISLAIQSTLKVIVIEGDNKQNNYRIIVNLYKDVLSLLEEEIEVDNMMVRYFPDVLSRRNIQMNVFKEKMKLRVEDDEDLKKQWDKLEIWIKELY